MKYIIANWKSNLNQAEVKNWVSEVKKSGLIEKLRQQHCEVVVCPSFIWMPTLKQAWPELTLGAQTVSPYPNGAYTGAVSALMVSEFAQYAILGHLERRTHFAETEPIVARQTVEALEAKLTPIIAVDDQNWQHQLSQLDRDQLAKVVLMYEPASAISTMGDGKAVAVETVEQKIDEILDEYKVKAVLYGGSVNAANVRPYLTAEKIAGVVPGASSLDPQKFIELLQAALSALSGK